jgi:hypothetical protein
MDDSTGVQRRESSQDPQADRQPLGHAQRPPPQTLGQRFALQQLHGDEQLAPVLADLVELAHVRMVDARRGPSLAPEPLPRRFVAAQRRHRLQSDHALQPLVARRVHGAHPALAELARDCVVPDAHGQAFLKAGGRGVRSDLRRGRRADQPVGEGAQPSPRPLVVRPLGHER